MDLQSAGCWEWEDIAFQEYIRGTAPAAASHNQVLSAEQMVYGFLQKEKNVPFPANLRFFFRGNIEQIPVRNAEWRAQLEIWCKDGF